MAEIVESIKAATHTSELVETSWKLVSNPGYEPQKVAN